MLKLFIRLRRWLFLHGWFFSYYDYDCEDDSLHYRVHFFHLKRVQINVAWLVRNGVSFEEYLRLRRQYTDRVKELFPRG